MEDVREVGLVMSEAEGGGYEEKQGGELVLRFYTRSCLALGSNLMEGLWMSCVETARY